MESLSSHPRWYTCPQPTLVQWASECALPQISQAMPGPGKVFSLSATLSPIPLLPLLRADQSHLGTFCRARRREGPRGEPAPLAWSGDLGQKSAPLHAPAPVLGFVVPSGWERSTRPGPGTVRASQRGCLSGDPYLSVGSSLWLETCFQADCETLKMGATGCPRGTSHATGKLPTALTGDGREAACSSRECGRAGLPDRRPEQSAVSPASCGPAVSVTSPMGRG